MTLVPGSGGTQNAHQKNVSTGDSLIGQRLPLVDAMGKTTGQALYTDDLRIPGTIECRILRSPKAHALIEAIDTQEAESMPGVHAVVTGKELQTTFGVLPISHDQTAMAVDKAHYIGECVAAVAADTEAIAAEAVQKIKITWKDLKNFQDLKLGQKDVGENQIHAKVDKKHPGTNVHKAVDQNFGDVNAAFEAAATSHKDTFKFAPVNHGFTEPHSTVAHWDCDDRLVVYTAQQVVHYLHKALSEVFGLPMHQVRVVKPAVGGGFGGKSDPFPHEFVASLLSQKTRRPVRVTFDREEVFLTNHGRHGTEMTVEMGADKEGNITALRNNVALDGGAFGSFGVVTSYYNGVLSNGPYDLENFEYHGKRLYTNRPPSGAMRGHGSVNSRFATETLIDRMANDLGIDPIEFRLKNILTENTTTRHHKFRVTSNGLRQCI